MNIGKIKFKNIVDFLFLLYLCAIFAHQLGNGFDAMFVRITFVLYICSSFLFIYKRNKFRINSFLKWYIIFIAYIFISVLWSNNKTDALAYFNNFIQCMAIIICLEYRIKSYDDLKRILKLIISAIIYMVILLIIKSPSNHWGTELIGSALGMWKNSVGLECAIGFIISIFLCSNSNKKITKILYSIIGVALGVVILLSGSRKALLMVPIALVIYILFNKKRDLNIKNIFKFIFASCIFVAMLYFIYTFIMSNEMLYQTIGRRLDSLQGGKDVSNIERIFYINKAIELFKQNPIWGYGSNGFVTYMREINYSHVAYSHNNFTELLATLGIIGFFIFYYMQLKEIVLLSPFRIEDNENRKLFCIFWVLVLLLLIFGWWLVYYYSETYILLFALAYHCINIGKEGNKL